jgi:DNA-binding response OmpR family regulator
MRILLVEDEAQLRAHIDRALVRAGHEVRVAGDGEAALAAVSDHRFDLMVLDVNLPGRDGFEVLREIRARRVPVRVLMLTARSEVADRVAGLRGGADDYLTKPFAMEELLARIEVLGRWGGGGGDRPSLLQAGELSMDTARRRVSWKGSRIELSPREFEVLQIFMQEPGRTFSRDEICERIWEREHEYDTRTVEIFIMRLRKKLGHDAGAMIATVRGVGYVLEVPA